MDAGYIEIICEDENELMTCLEDYTVNDLKMMARCLSRHINNKIHGYPLYGEHYVKEITLDCCAKTPAPKAVAPVPVSWTLSNCTFTGCDTGLVLNSKENDMNYNTATTAADYGFAETRKHLLNRLASVEQEKVNAAEEKYLPVTELPKNGKELKEAIANGWLVVPVKDDTQFNWNSWTNFVELQDPAKPRNLTAFEAAVKAIVGGKKETKDDIMVLPQADGLAALRKYEGTTYH